MQKFWEFSCLHTFVIAFKVVANSWYPITENNIIWCYVLLVDPEILSNCYVVTYSVIDA